MSVWRSPFLRWLETVQAITGVRKFPNPIFSQLVARHDVGETAEDAAAWIKEICA